MKFLLSVSKGIDTITEAFGRIAQWIVPLVILVGFLNVLLRKLGDTAMNAHRLRWFASPAASSQAR